MQGKNIFIDNGWPNYLIITKKHMNGVYTEFKLPDILYLKFTIYMYIL